MQASSGSTPHLWDACMQAKAIDSDVRDAAALSSRPARMPACMHWLPCLHDTVHKATRQRSRRCRSHLQAAPLKIRMISVK